MFVQQSENPSSFKRTVSVALVGLLALGPGSVWAAAGESGTAVPASGLFVESDPAGATVYVDGQFTGQTPLRVGTLSKGDHRVRLVKDGYLENGRVVTVGSDRAQNVQVKLTRRASSATPEAAAQVSGGGGGSSNMKWVWIGAAAGGGVAAVVLLKGKNSAPSAGTAAVSPGGTGMAGVTNFSFTSAGASDPDGDPLTFDWDFGDNTTHGSGATASHVYLAPGTFSVKLTVSDNQQHSVSPANVSVTVARSLAGTWTGPVDPGFASNVSITLAQNGTTLTGTMTLAGGGAVGTVNLTGTSTGTTYPCTVAFTTSPFTVQNLTGTFTIGFSGNTDATGTTIVGTMTDSSTAQGPRTAAATFRR
jgi:PKD repeat protein